MEQSLASDGEEQIVPQFLWTVMRPNLTNVPILWKDVSRLNILLLHCTMVTSVYLFVLFHLLPTNIFIHVKVMFIIKYRYYANRQLTLHCLYQSLEDEPSQHLL